MSRIGKKIIALPSGVNMKIDGRLVNVKGPKGDLSWEHPERIKVVVTDREAQVERMDESQQTRALHGLSRSLVNNMVVGVSDGYQRVLEITGVGYRAAVAGDTITFSLGYSHPVLFKLPAGIKAEVDKKQTILTITAIDKQMLGQTIADIRSLRPPDAYKGKGVRNSGERIKLKAGKAAKK